MKGDYFLDISAFLFYPPSWQVTASNLRVGGRCV